MCTRLSPPWELIAKADDIWFALGSMTRGVTSISMPLVLYSGPSSESPGISVSSTTFSDAVCPTVTITAGAARRARCSGCAAGREVEGETP